MSPRVRQWTGRHKYVSATILIGGVSFLCLVVGGAAAGSEPLNRVAGALALILFLGLIIYGSISVAKGIRDWFEMAEPLMNALAVFAMFLLGLFVLIWIIKRMWEAA
jgi:hypothetical protein